MPVPHPIRRLLIATALTAAPLLAQDRSAPSAPTFADQFRDPPPSARPRVWWHWMNGNITKEGIAKDIAWMKRVGIGGMQTFDVNLRTPTVVDRRLAYMTPEWRDAFRFAAAEADRQGLELAIASSPGWSETGGPWVKPGDGLKKLVWSETDIAGGRRYAGTLAAPSPAAGPFRHVPMQPDLSALLMEGHEEVEAGPAFYQDVAVLAVPVTPGATLPAPVATDGTGKRVDAGSLADADPMSGPTLGPAVGGPAPSLVLTYPRPVTLRSATMFLPGAAIPLVGALIGAELQASDDGEHWRDVTAFAVDEVPTTVSFPAVTASRFRLLVRPSASSAPGSEAPDLGLAMENPFGTMIGRTITRPVTVGELRLSAEPRIDRFEAKAGFAIVPDYYALPTPADDAAGAPSARTIDVTRFLTPDGRLDWTPPAGRWRILRIGYSLLGTTNHPAPKEATGLEVDKFDGGAVRRYLEHYIGTYRAATGPELIGRRGVQALLTDSIEIGAANWTPRMVEQFRRLRGYDPMPWMPALFGTLVGSRAQSDRFLYDYRRTLSDLIASEHYGTVAAVAHENGLKVYGEALESNRPNLGDDMAMRAHADVPMGAMWAFDRKAGPGLNYVVDVKGAASVSHIYGRNLVAAESMTAAMAPWAFGPADLKRVIDLEFVLGVNRPVVHTSVHVPVDDKQPGLSLGGIGQFFNRNESWADLARPWVDYMSRNALLLQQGTNVADVAYFYGEEAPLTGLYSRNPVADAPQTSAYDFVNVSALFYALSNDGADIVSRGGARYKLLYLGGSSRRMTLGTLRRLATLAEGGATIVGTRPEGSPSLDDDAQAYAALVAKLWPGGAETRVGRGRVIAITDVEAALRRIAVAPDFRFTGGTKDATIPFLHRRLADGDSYFLVNRLDRGEIVEAHFRITGKAPELWSADTGSVTPLSYRIGNGETIVPLTLAGEQAMHVVFRTAATADRLTVSTPAPVVVADLSAGWDVAFQPGGGAPATARIDRLAPLDANADPAIRYFSGIATYTRTFDAPRGWKPGELLLLDLGEAREIAEVRVNGAPAGYAWHAPYRLDIGTAARSGRNRLEVRVANLWVNRMIGDQQPGATKVTWTGDANYRADAPLRRSGLIGPVRLLGTSR